jgi:hypothetical protein
MIEILINVLLLCAILGIVWWVLSAIPMPAPLALVARIAFGVLAIILLLGCFNVVPTLHLYHHRRM